MNPHQFPLAKIQLISLIASIILCLATINLLNVFVSTSSWLIAHSQLFNVGIIEHEHRQRILMECMQGDFPFPSDLPDAGQNEELRTLGKLIGRLKEKIKQDEEKIRRLIEEEGHIMEEQGKISDKQKELRDECDKMIEEMQQYEEEGRNEEVSQLVEKCEQNHKERKRLCVVHTQYQEEFDRTKEEFRRISAEIEQNNLIILLLEQEFNRRLIEDERKRNRYRTCREQFRQYEDEDENYGDED